MTLQTSDEFYDEIYAFLQEPLVNAKNATKLFLSDYQNGRYDVEGAEEYEIDEAIAMKLEEYIPYAESILSDLKNALKYATALKP